MTQDVTEAVREALHDTVGRIPTIANADAVVGPPQEKSGRIAIPLATVSAGFGLGMGGGSNDDPHENGEDDGLSAAHVARMGRGSHGDNGGGGGGGVAKARPVAVVELTEADLNVHQVVDSTRIAVASLVLAGWCVFWITRTIRAFRRD